MSQVMQIEAGKAPGVPWPRPRVWVSISISRLANGYMVTEHPFGYDYNRGGYALNDVQVFATQKEVGAFIVKALTKGV